MWACSWCWRCLALLGFFFGAEAQAQATWVPATERWSVSGSGLSGVTYASSRSNACSLIHAAYVSVNNFANRAYTGVGCVATSSWQGRVDAPYMTVCTAEPPNCDGFTPTLQPNTYIGATTQSYACEPGEQSQGTGANMLCLRDPPEPEPECPAPGTPDGGYTYNNPYLGTWYYCVSGCLVQSRSDGCFGEQGTAGFSCPAEGKFTGSSCVGEPGAPPTQNPGPPMPPDRPDEPPCPTGQCLGQVNGNDVCVPCGDHPDGQEHGGGTTDETTTHPDGTTTQTTTTTTNTCTGAGSCTTTTTTTTTHRDDEGNVTGTATTTTVTVTDRGTFCDRNPNAVQCSGGGEGGGSAFGGSCASGFTCDGDAVQCAMAREQHRVSCLTVANLEPMALIGETAVGGGLQPEGHPRQVAAGEAEALDLAGRLDQTAHFGASCPPDVNVTAFGQVVAIPFSELCTPLQWMGYIIVAFTFLASIAIVFRS